MPASGILFGFLVVIFPYFSIWFPSMSTGIWGRSAAFWFYNKWNWSGCDEAKLNLCLYLRWPAQPLWGSPSPLPSRWRWRRDAPGAPGTAGYSGTQKPCGERGRFFREEAAPKEQMVKCETTTAPSRRGTVFRCCSSGDRPADQTEPGETVVEGVSSSQGVVTVLHGAAGELCSTVVHFSHQVQSLPAGGDTSTFLLTVYVPIWKHIQIHIHLFQSYLQKKQCLCTVRIFT